MSVVVEERRIEVGGLSTRYLEAGAGEPLVLLHALVGASEMLAAMTSRTR